MAKKQTLLQTLSTLPGTLVDRLNLFNGFGKQYGGDRNLFQALGYPDTIEYSDYWLKYKRQDIAKAIINRPVSMTWKGDLRLTENKDDQETTFEKAWETLEEQLNLKSKLIRLDKLTCLGHYAVLLLGFDDVKCRDEFLLPVEGTTRKLLYVRPVSEYNAKVDKWEANTNDSRYGLPTVYNITLNESGSGGKSYSLQVHHSRILHTVFERLEEEINGLPVLESVYNRLMDLEKLVGGSAEMFWRGARPGYSGELKDDFKMSDKMRDDLKDQIDEYEHDLRRILVSEGINMKELAMQIADPKSHVDVQIQMISAVTGIPKRMLTGSERGELSSTQDQDEWRDYIKTRREEYTEVEIVRPFAERCIKFGVLPKPITGKYSVAWSDLFAKSEKDLAEVGKIRASALKEYVSVPAAEEVIPPAAFFEFLLGLDKNKIDLIKEMQEAAIIEEPVITKEEKEIEDKNEIKKEENKIKE